MLIIGSHVSFDKENQLVKSVKEAISYQANTFMFYTGAPQNTNRSKINLDKTKEAKEMMEENNINIDNVIVHAPYIINLANYNNLDFGISFLKEELARCEELGIKKIVLHPGSHVGLGSETGLNNIVEALNQVLTKDDDITICLETMAGKGSELGTTIDQLKYIIDNCKLSDKIGVCLDSCHLHDGGYDLTKFDDLLIEIEEKIGLDKIKCVHINDSKNSREAHKDRHENLGLGHIGFETLINIIYHPKLKEVPKILETPYVSSSGSSKDKLYPPYKFEIDMIKNKEFNFNLIEDIRSYYK